MRGEPHIILGLTGIVLSCIIPLIMFKIVLKLVDKFSKHKW